MKAIVKTKSNYKGLNGQWLQVSEISGTRVTCIVYSEELNKMVSVDFSISEVVEFTQMTFKN